MNKYDSYKDSGVEWIGEIPSHWRKSKTNFLSSNYDGKRVPLNGTQRSEMEGEIPYWGSNGVVDYINKSMFNEELVLVGEDGSPFFDIYKPISFKVTGDVWINNHIHVLKHKESEVLSDFLVHSFNITDFKEFITGSTRDKLTQSDLSRIPHFLPPLSEQQQIVTFLDDKTQKIDSLIQQKEKKIELLKEKRTSLINHVVTKGLNSNVEMKDSGVEWIGEIPSHFEVVKLKYLCSVSTGGKDTQDKIDEGLYPFYVRSPKIERINSYSFDGESVLTVGDGVGVGKVFHYVNGKFEYHQRVYKFSDFKRVTGKFFYWFMKYHFIFVTEDQNSKSTVDSLRRPLIDEFQFVVPSLQKQQEIIEYLDKQTEEIETLIQLEQKKIDTLKEYRQSLISEVVTGKIRVCEEDNSLSLNSQTI